MNPFFDAVGLDPLDRASTRDFARRTSVSVHRMNYYDAAGIVPGGRDLASICEHLGIAPEQLMLRMGRLDHSLIAAVQEHADDIWKIIAGAFLQPAPLPALPDPVFETDLGSLYRSDCISLLRSGRVPDDSIDLVFADPPFNLNKLYPSGYDDNLKRQQYLAWSEEWLAECIRVLRPGGSLFLWNLPRWNTSLGEFLNGRLTFRHWIAVDMKYTLPIAGRLYPAHYSLLYYSKGETVNTFRPDRLPLKICSKCLAELKSYGGYKGKMNPRGVSLSDLWDDIPPVRHPRIKRRVGANELSIRLLDRVIQLASNPGDTIFDPFGGSGTTYAVAEIRGRRWIGTEIGPVDGIIDRLANLDEERERLRGIRLGMNRLFSTKHKRGREEVGLWTPKSLRAKSREQGA